MRVVIETGDDGRGALELPYGGEHERPFDIPQKLWEDWCALQGEYRALYERRKVLLAEARKYED